MSADAFSAGLMGGYAFVDNIFNRRRQLALQEREMRRQDVLDQRATTQWNQAQRDRDIRLAEEDLQRRIQGVTATQGDDPTKWDPQIRAEIDTGLRQLDGLKRSGDPNAGRDPGASLTSAIGAVDSAYAQRVGTERMRRGDAADLALLAGPGPAAAPAAPAPAPRGLRAVASQGVAAVGASAPVQPGAPAAAAPLAQVAATAGAAGVEQMQRDAATPSGRRSPWAPQRGGDRGVINTDSLAKQQADADANRLTLGRAFSNAVDAVGSAVGGVVDRVSAAYDQGKKDANGQFWTNVADPTNQGTAFQSYRRDPAKHFDEWMSTRADAPAPVRKKLDAHFLPAAQENIAAARQRIDALQKERDALKAQPEGYDNEDSYRRRQIGAELKNYERKMGQWQANLRDIARTYSMSEAIGAPQGAKPGPELAKAASQAVLPRAGEVSGARLKADAAIMARTPVEPNLQAAVSQPGAVMRGQATPQGMPAGVRQPMTISKERLDAATRLYVHGALSPEKYAHFLEYGTLKDVTTIEELKGFDPYTPKILRKNGEIANYIPGARPAAARGGLTAAQALRMVQQQRSATSKALLANAKDNKKAVDVMSKVVAKSISGGAKEGEDGFVDSVDIGLEFTDFATTFAEQFKAKGIDVSQDFANMSRAQVNEVFSAYRDWKLAATEREQTNVLWRWAMKSPTQEEYAAGVQGKAAPMSFNEWKTRIAAQYGERFLQDVPEDEQVGLYQEDVAE